MWSCWSSLFSQIENCDLGECFCKHGGNDKLRSLVYDFPSVVTDLRDGVSNPIEFGNIEYFLVAAGLRMVNHLVFASLSRKFYLKYTNPSPARPIICNS